MKNAIFKNVPLIFQRFIGAKFHLNGFHLPNPLRNKGSERMVTKPPNMTLLFLFKLCAVAQMWLYILNKVFSTNRKQMLRHARDRLQDH